MIRAFALVWVGLVLAPRCPAQTSAMTPHLEELADHWRWSQYWRGTTDLGPKYREGLSFQALFFWRIDRTYPDLGFCSNALAVCLYYERVAPMMARGPDEMKMAPGEDLQSAFKRLVAETFKLPLLRSQYRLPGVRPPQPEDYATEIQTIVLPALDPPRAVRERKPRPAKELEELKEAVGCPGEKERVGCRRRLLIPFYNETDPQVSVYRECSKECSFTKPAILFPKLLEDGHWFMGATNTTVDPSLVRAARRQIEKALMLEVK